MEQKRAKTKRLKTGLCFMQLNLDILYGFKGSGFKGSGLLCELCALSEAGGEKIFPPASHQHMED